MKLVVNASPIILLAAADQLSLLHKLADQIVVPAAVVAELEAGNLKDQATKGIHAVDWIRIADPIALPPEVGAWDLGAGETAVLSWARAQVGFTCVLDDRAARNCAQALGLACVGTLGIVLAAKEASLLQAARPVLEEMKRAGFYLAGAVLERSLRTVGE